ncbi:MAG TPA: NADH-quinone oxidoreductase subunit L, partial [Thermoanaerobaculia bacterium]
LVALLGWFLARRWYRDRALTADATFERRSPAMARAIENKWYVDELYGATVVRPLEGISRFFWKVVDAIIDGLAATLGFVASGFGDLLRFFQTGNVRNYALMFFAGVVAFIVFFA